MTGMDSETAITPLSPTLADPNLAALVASQRQFFATGQTRARRFRLAQLQRLKQLMVDHQTRIAAALQADLGKPPFEAYAAELVVVKEIDHACAHLQGWMRARRVSSPLELAPGWARIQPEPVGCVLILGPWNYPWQLLIAPLVGAMAAGNCAVLKPSELAPHTGAVLADLIGKAFDPAYVAVVEGDAQVGQALLQERFDHIFFTGGSAVGRQVMAAAARHLTPVTLELGGKSPCVVQPDVPLTVTARRIIWGKFLNAGQSCIAPDYLLVHRAIKPQLVQALLAAVCQFYGADPRTSQDYGRIIHDRHWLRLVGLMQGELICGGEVDRAERYIAPTLIDGVTLDHPAMQEEIFGPILPILTYETIEEAIGVIQQRPQPLTVYLFSCDRTVQAQVQREVASGSFCINETMTHNVVPTLPFGGVGASGLGSYHGKAGFDCFSQYRSVWQKPFWLDFALRYPPYGGKLGLLKLLLFRGRSGG